MPPKITLGCNYLKACNLLWLVKVMGYSQNQAGHIVGVAAGTVCHVIHGRRFSDAFPIPMML